MSNGASIFTRTKVLMASTISATAALAISLVGIQPADAHHGGRAARLGSEGSPAPAPATPSKPSNSFTAPTQQGQVAPQQAVTASLGATGENVKKIEQRLRELHYYVGTVDNEYDDNTAQGVTAFQKVHEMDRTGNVDANTWNKMTTAKDPSPLVPGGGERRVEVDVSRQVLFLYKGNKLSEIVAVSTGSEEPYCENGSCGDAVTPRGDYRIYRQGSGWEYGALGALYNPSYFVGGFAIHGSNSVPPEPASHGCVRIPMSVAEWFPNEAPLDTPVYVRD